MVLSKHLRALTRLQHFDNRMDALYRHGLPPDSRDRRLGPKQKQFIRQRKTLLRKLDGTLVHQYERLRSSRIKANAIVPVVNGVCRGCFMVVTKSLVAELMESTDIITCEHCGRLLYLK